MQKYSLKKRVLLLVAVSSLVVIVTAKPAPDDSAWIVRRVVREEESTETTMMPEEVKEEAEQEGDVPSSSPKIYSMNIKSSIRLRYATTKVTSRVANPSAKSQETTFHVVLPDSAYISGFVMEINGTSYTATVKEKEAAQKEYDTAVSQGQSAAQVASVRDANQFTVSLNIEPQAKVTFNLTYDELLVRRLGVYEQAIHINPGQVVPDLTVDVSISEVLPIKSIKVPQLQQNDIQKNEDDKLEENESAKIERINATDATISFKPSKEEQQKISRDGLQGQFVVQYDVDRSSVEKQGGEVHIVDGYFIHFFAPSSLPSLPKHVVFVLDTSGSMEGTKLEQTKQAMDSILDQLHADDLFSVIEFSSTAQEWDLAKAYQPPEWVYDPPKENETLITANDAEAFGNFDNIKAYPATKRAIERGKLFSRSMRAAGGTNINEAMLRALNNSQSVQSVTKLTPMIIFLTDGDPSVGVTSTDSILDNVKKANNDGLVSVYCLSFGADADFTFLKKMSLQNKAFARKIYEASDATLQLKGFYSEVANPVLADVKFDYDGTVYNVTQTRLGNFFNGTEIVVAGQVNENATVRATVNALEANGLSYRAIWNEKSIPEAGPKQSDSSAKPPTRLNFSLEKTWAYLTIKDLLKKSEAEDRSLYKDKALKIALGYKFVTPLTSLLVVKPNQNASVAGLKAADGASRDEEGDTLRVRPLFSAAPLALAAPNRIVGGANYGSYYAQQNSVAPAPLAEYAEIEDAYEADEAYEEPSPQTSSAPAVKYPTTTTTTTRPVYPHKFVESFHYNATFVTLPIGNQIWTLQWQNDIPETDYQPCNATYSVGNATDGFCRPIWSCPTLNVAAFGDYCVIENSHVGVCCVLST